MEKTPKVYFPKRDVFLSMVAGYLPKDVVTNEEFVKRSGLTTGAATRASWIEARTGINSRCWAHADQGCSDLAVCAVEKLFSEFPLFREQTRHLLLATISGDYPSPPTSAILQNKLGLQGSSTVDLGAACAGFTMGILLGAMVQTSTNEPVLLVASDIRSKFLNLQDYNTAPLFGDAAAAAMLTGEPISKLCYRVRGARSFTDGSHSDMIMIPGGGSAPDRREKHQERHCLTIFDGAKIFLKAREAFVVGSELFLKEMDVSLNQIAYLVPHQANSLIIREVKKDLGLRDDQVVETVSWTGNTSGASVGIALEELQSRKVLKNGDLILIAAAGGGGVVAHALLECVI